jgi:uncharacterized repeat protein (TIGR03837 family)
MKLRWDIFCKVIDNFGDIGIAWRLARQLTGELEQTVRLWVDNLESFQRLEPGLHLNSASQVISEVEIRHWGDTLPDVEPAQVVIEAQACRLPEPYLQKMAAMAAKPVWINLEYLSAENWVKDCHGLASPHPRLPLTQTFFIPGFGSGTGGLLGSPRQHDALGAWRQTPGERERFFSSLGVAFLPDQALTVSLFAYDNPAIGGLLEALAEFHRPAFLIVPEGKVSGRVADWLQVPAMQPGRGIRCGHLCVQPISFLDHDHYDRLLWMCDLNCVRGEDSFIQAQWAARPLIWQPYVQEDGAQWNKLQAFLAHYRQGLEPGTAELLAEVWRVWNAGELDREIWRIYLDQLPEFVRHAGRWEQQIKSWPNLGDELVKYALSRIQLPVFQKPNQDEIS